MADEVFEEWDEDFLEEAIQLEERAISSSSVSSQSQPRPPPPSNPSAPLYFVPSELPQPQPQPTQSRIYPNPSSSSAPVPPPISHSPPRELSQRPVDQFKPPPQHRPSNGHSLSDSAKELEIERLKKELGRVSKQLASREQECAKLRKESVENEEKLKSAVFPSQRTVSKDCSLQDNSRCSREVDDVKLLATSKSAPASTHKAVGVQTEKPVEATGQLQINDGLQARHDISTKLLSIWSPPFDSKVESGLVSNLFATFCGLFKCMGPEVSSRILLDSMADDTLSDLSFRSHPSQSFTADNISKVSRLYSVLQEVSNGGAELEALLEPVVDLCALDNVIVLHQSLRILHFVLKHLLVKERKTEPRDNIKIERSLAEDDVVMLDGTDGAKTISPLSVKLEETSMILDPLRSSGTKCQLRNVLWNCGRTEAASSVNWISLFEVMNKIIKKQKSLRLVAVSIMNLILQSSNAYEEREKFQLQLVAESISELLKKGCGSRVQKEALHFLFLLLNCPKILDKFCSDHQNIDRPSCIDKILQGLAGCLRSHGTSIEDLQLRRKAITLLAFLASSGTAGFEILASHQLPYGVNFLMLILQALSLELDAEDAGSYGSPELLKERTLIMREGLILLNRLVSNNNYASTSFQVLTNSRDMLSLTVDVSNRMSQKPLWLGQFESRDRQSREFEIVDLARTFKKRVFTYLGDV